MAATISPPTPLTAGGISGASARVSVVCRLRPPRDASSPAVGAGFSVDTKEKLVSVRNPRHGMGGSGAVDNTVEDYRFQVNDVLVSASQDDAFTHCARDLADQVLNGISCTLLAYGQTGSGKTHSMVGPAGSFPQRGVIPRAIEYVCQRVEAMRSEALLSGGRSDGGDESMRSGGGGGSGSITLRCSYLELYNDTLIDLLAANPDFASAAAGAGAGGDGDGDMPPDLGSASMRYGTAGGRSGTAGGAGGGAGGGKPRSTFGSVTTDETYQAHTRGSGAGGAGAGGRPPELSVHEDRRGRVHVRGLSTPVIHSEAEAFNLLFAGEANRAIAEHALNKASTRSHCIFTLYVEQQMPADVAGGAGTAGAGASRSRAAGRRPAADDGSMAGGSEASDAAAAAAAAVPLVTVVSKLHLVDLAGSERVFKSQSEGALQREAGHINKSLSFLEQVVLALLDPSRGPDGFVPFRSCKLTHLLKESLYRGKTRLLACVWPEPTFIDETISTLRFATRMMHVKTALMRDVVSSAMSDAERARIVAAYEGEIAMLRAELALHDALAGRTGGGPGGAPIKYAPLDAGELASLDRSVRAFIDADDADLGGGGAGSASGAAGVLAPGMGGAGAGAGAGTIGVGGDADLKLPTVRHFATALRMMRVMVRQLRGHVGTLLSTAGAAPSDLIDVDAIRAAMGSGSGRSGSPRRQGTSRTPPGSQSTVRHGETVIGGAAPPSQPPDLARPYRPGEAEEALEAVVTGAVPLPRGSHAGSDDGSGSGSDDGRAARSGAGASAQRDRGPLPPTAEQQRASQQAAAAALAADEGARTAELSAWRAPTGPGGKLYRDYQEARDSLRGRRTAHAAAAAAVNEAKKDIDALVVSLQEASAGAGATGSGSSGAAGAEGRAAAGEPTEEARADAVRRLTDAKARYRTRYDELTEAKAEADYLQRVSDQLAQRIAGEFQRHWLAKCAAAAIAGGFSKVADRFPAVFPDGATGPTGGSGSDRGPASPAAAVYENASLRSAAAIQLQVAASSSGVTSPGRFAHSSKSGSSGTAAARL